MDRNTNLTKSQILAGSLLVSAAQFGGYVCGADIDFLMIHGKTRPVRPNHKVNKSIGQILMPSD